MEYTAINKYTAINIGPIISTFDMVRKPRELWAASYLFSHLMKCIFNEINKTKGIEVFSPNMSESEEKIGVGLYPDRVYCTGTWDFNSKREAILNAFANELSDDADFKDYFNIMCVTIDGEGLSKTQAIRKMNHLLDCLELNERAVSDESKNAVWDLISNNKEKLFELAFPKGEFAKLTDEYEDYGTLAAYASVQLSSIDDESKAKWKEALSVDIIEEYLRNEYPSFFLDKVEDAFYRKLKESFPEVKDETGKSISKIKSYHKYICIVQADGDNMGKTFSHEGLAEGKTAEISKELVTFGKEASKKIYEYGGLPIYAGGDDLLFLAPVVGKTRVVDGEISRPQNIIDLLKDIDICFNPVKEMVETEKLTIKDKDNNPIIVSPSMSYGVSITYYKFPLYEALKSAQHLLFDVAKEVDGKNAIAWCLQKNSGSSFSGAFSKTNVLHSFEKVILSSSVKESLVSAVSHKIRENQALLQLWLGDASYQQRNLNFFKKYMDYDEKDGYKQSILEMLDNLYEIYQPLLEAKDKGTDKDANNGKIKLLPTDKANGVFTLEAKVNYLKQSNRDELFKMIYSMIRTAKFISGEEVRDE